MKIYIFILLLSLVIIFFENAIKAFFVNYVFESDLKKLLSYENNRDIQTFQLERYQKASKYLLLLLFFPLLNFNFYYFIFILALSFIAYKSAYFKIKKTFKYNLAMVRYQFPIWLRSIQVLLHNNNVLNALVLSYDLAPVIIKNDLKTLIADLKANPNDIQSFIKFMKIFEISEIDRAMKLLYRTYIVDKEESNKQLNRMITSTTKWIRQERISNQNNRLDIYEWIGIIPLFGVTIIFLVIMASVINNLFVRGVNM